MTQSLLSRLERQGLQGRIESALSGLLWLSQEYETLTKHVVDETFISDAQSLWREGKLDDLRQLVAQAADLYALNLDIFKASRASKEDMERVPCFIFRKFIDSSRVSTQRLRVDHVGARVSCSTLERD
jgi:hypothetical protein